MLLFIKRFWFLLKKAFKIQKVNFYHEDSFAYFTITDFKIFYQKFNTGYYFVNIKIRYRELGSPDKYLEVEDNISLKDIDKFIRVQGLLFEVDDIDFYNLSKGFSLDNILELSELTLKYDINYNGPQFILMISKPDKDNSSVLHYNKSINFIFVEHDILINREEIYKLIKYLS